MSEELPPYVHKKLAKGRPYYYFSMGYNRADNTVRLVRLPDFVHLRGEWFERCPEIEAEIGRLNSPEQEGNK